MYIPPEQLVTDYTVLSVATGPRVYGLETQSSDFDRRSVYAAPTAAFWGFDKPPTNVDGPEKRRTSWEIERFLNLALAADPVVLECLWSPAVEYSDDIGDGLVALRRHLISRRLYRSFMGRANSQVDRLTGPSTSQDWQRVMHTLRLLISAAHFLRTGEPLLRVDTYRERLLAVQAGEVDWSQVQAWRDRLSSNAQDALSATKLPIDPDREAADHFLIEVRRRRV